MQRKCCLLAKILLANDSGQNGVVFNLEKVGYKQTNKHVGDVERVVYLFQKSNLITLK